MVKLEESGLGNTHMDTFQVLQKGLILSSFMPVSIKKNSRLLWKPKLVRAAKTVNLYSEDIENDSDFIMTIFLTVK